MCIYTWISYCSYLYTRCTVTSIDFDLTGTYIVIPRTPGSWEKRFRIYSLPLTPTKESMCLQFWLVFLPAVTFGNIQLFCAHSMKITYEGELR